MYVTAHYYFGAVAKNCCMLSMLIGVTEIQIAPSTVFFNNLFSVTLWWVAARLYLHLYYYMRNFYNWIGLEQWYFSLIWNTYM